MHDERVRARFPVVVRCYRLQSALAIAQAHSISSTKPTTKDPDQNSRASLNRHFRNFAWMTCRLGVITRSSAVSDVTDFGKLQCAHEMRRRLVEILKFDGTSMFQQVGIVINHDVGPHTDSKVESFSAR